MPSDRAQPKGPPPESEPPLRELSARQLAGLIRALDSRLLGIAYDDSAGEPALVYSFEVAGKIQRFSLAVRPEGLTSIADLYPAAAAYERELAGWLGLAFH
ncbi:MAG: NADH-quinone oxidoreductase subunit C [Kouleothrix sp.]|nr:NADH-quinone oxidoreductase subunit C [Kouleothrix sp.]